MNILCKLGFHKFKCIRKDADIIYEDVKCNKPLKVVITATADTYSCMRFGCRARKNTNIRNISVAKEAR